MSDLKIDSEKSDGRTLKKEKFCRGNNESRTFFAKGSYNDWPHFWSQKINRIDPRLWLRQKTPV